MKPAPQPVAAASARSSTASASSCSRRTCRRSAPKPFTTRMPVEALLDDARDVGELLLDPEVHRRDPPREARRRDVEERQRAEREHREHPFFGQHDPEHAEHREGARDGERDQDDRVLDLLDVGVGACHELAGLGLVVEREVQPLQVGEQAVAQVGLGAQRDAERRVAAEAGAEACTTPMSTMRIVSRMTLPWSPTRMPSSIADAARSGTVSLAAVQHDAGHDAADDPPGLRADRVGHEPPTGAAQRAVDVGRRRRSEVGDRTRVVEGTPRRPADARGSGPLLGVVERRRRRAPPRSRR